MPDTRTNEQLAIGAKAGNREDLHTLCERLQPLIRKVARQYNTGGSLEDQEDLQQALYEQLISVIPRYDPNRNAKVFTFVLPWLRLAAQRCRQQLRPIKVPDDVMRRLYEYRSLRADGLSNQQILQATGWDRRILDLLRYYDQVCSPPLSLSSTYTTEDGTELSLEDTLVDYESERAFQSIVDTLSDDEIMVYVLGLPEPIRTVLIERYLNDQKTPLRDLGEKLHLSQTQIRRVQRDGLRMVEREFRKRGLIERLAFSSTGFGRMTRSFTSNVEEAALELLGET